MYKRQVLDPTSNASAIDGLSGLGNSISHTTGGSVNPNTNIQQPQVVYATHGSHHHHSTAEAPKEDQQLFHSTKF